LAQQSSMALQRLSDADDQAAGAELTDACEGGVELRHGAGMQIAKLYAERACRPCISRDCASKFG
jgi:hypothetical protein